MAAAPGLIRLAVFGHPVSHSLSPAIHQQFAAQLRLNVSYCAIDAEPDAFLGALREFAGSGTRGCNVTVPLKRQAWQAAARSSAVAQRAGAANTLVFDSASDWFADNTDGRGLVRDLQRQRPGCLQGEQVLLLGAGGAAAGVLGALLEARPAMIHIANRTPERAQQLAARHADSGSLDASGLDELERHAPFDLVIQATSAGHGGTPPELDPGLFTPGSLCYDLNYGAAAQALRALCAGHGIAHSDGLGMLVEQAGLSFELWTGQQPDCAAVLENLRARPS